MSSLPDAPREMLPCKSEKCRAAIGQSGHFGRAVADSEAMEGLLFWVRDQVDLRLQGRIHPVNLPARQPAPLLFPFLFVYLFVCLFVCNAGPYLRGAKSGALSRDGFSSVQPSLDCDCLNSSCCGVLVRNYATDHVPFVLIKCESNIGV